MIPNKNPAAGRILSLDQWGHTIYLNLSDCVAIYFQNGKPRHVRFWPERLPAKDRDPKKTHEWVSDTFKRMGFNVSLDPWREQDIDDKSHGGIIANVKEIV